MKKLFLLLFLLLMSIHVRAAPGDLILEADLAINKFALDRYQNIIYASMKDNTVAVIDMDAGAIKKIIPVGTSPQGMAVSWDNTKLYVALAGASRLEVIDLESYTALQPYVLNAAVGDVAVDAQSRIYTVDSGINRGLKVIDPITNTITNVNCFSCYSSMLAMSSDGETMFLANRGLSPGTIEKFDVSGNGLPVSLWRNGHGSLGSNGQDLWLTPDGKHVYYAMGSGNRILGYDIAQIDVETLAINGSFNTGAYPREIVTSQDGKVAYAVHTSGHIDVWDTNTFNKIREYKTVGEAHELFAFGGYLLAAFEDKLRVYEAEPKVDSPVIDDADGDGIEDALDNCVNDANADQSDVDRDRIGDVCDPFPNHSNHELAQCNADLAAANDALNACKVELDLYK